MSVKRKILLACLGFVMIIALLGALARRQTDQMGRLASGIYDHSLIGIVYVNRTQDQFLHLVSGPDRNAVFSAPAKRAELQTVLDQLDVAMERASSEHTRAVGAQVRAMLAELPDIPAAVLPQRIAQADSAISRLVENYASDGLTARDDADEIASRSRLLVLIEVAFSLCLALALGLALAHNLSPPLADLVRSIGLLTAGDLEHELSPGLSLRRDEIGAVARATSVFREAMQRNIAAGEERVRLEARNEAARLNAERSEAAAKAKSDFLATMSHEIRTPMNGLATISDLLADSELSDDQAKMVDIIRHSSRWLIRVIDDILDFSKLEAHQLRIERVPYMLDEVLDGACEILAPKAREKGLALTIEGKDLPGLCRIGDPLRLRQILLNLIGNAVKFTAEGSVTLAVQVDPRQVSFSVIDTGIGIPADRIGSLFQPYNQIRSDTARSFGGTGLGLSITKNLVDLMEGRLEVTSTEGVGSCFTVILGLPSDVSSLCKTPNRPAASHIRWRKPDLALAAAQAAVVLCVEDNAINRDVLLRVLDRLGFNSEMAENGHAALALLDRRRHGVILTDAQMPRMDGWQLAHALRQQETEQSLPRMPIIMLTANVLSESGSRTAVVGFDTVLAKPLNIDELEATLLGFASALGILRTTATSHAPAAALAAQEIDLETLIQLVGDDGDILRSMLDSFQTGVIEQHDLIRTAAASGDAASLARHAHSVKGAARYAGATNLAAICHDLEQQANHDAQPEALANLLATLDAAVARLPAEVEAALSKRMQNPHDERVDIACIAELAGARSR